ncbi:hypothetical protein QYE76_053203 [Lolium multiflorum]|uniref:Uncharacterized protein n=1 Tax=Lolium multiflorum TaxID=4521 RepID=A0AAD8SVZ8_LOLMU|nr:hypothetical protein QYE76_053203 [Lolium multiflorum]
MGQPDRFGPNRPGNHGPRPHRLPAFFPSLTDRRDAPVCGAHASASSSTSNRGRPGLLFSTLTLTGRSISTVRAPSTSVPSSYINPKTPASVSPTPLSPPRRQSTAIARRSNQTRRRHQPPFAATRGRRTPCRRHPPTRLGQTLLVDYFSTPGTRRSATSCDARASTSSPPPPPEPHVWVLPPYEGPEHRYIAVSIVPIPHPETVVGQGWNHRLKPSYGICRDDTTTFGAHRGAISACGRCLLPDMPHHHHRRASRFRLDLEIRLLEAGDNVGCFADRPFPVGGIVISFGEHDVYIATVAPPRYPRQIQRCASPPPGAGASHNFTSPCVVQEVIATGDENADKTTRTRGPALECTAGGGASVSGPKEPPPPSRLDEVWEKLSSPLTAGADPTTIEADLESHRQLLLKQAEELAAAKRQLEITRREYDRAHGFTPAGNNPSRAGQIRAGEAPLAPRSTAMARKSRLLPRSCRSTIPPRRTCMRPKPPQKN